MKLGVQVRLIIFILLPSWKKIQRPFKKPSTTFDYNIFSGSDSFLIIKINTRSLVPFILCWYSPVPRRHPILCRTSSCVRPPSLPTGRQDLRFFFSGRSGFRASLLSKCVSSLRLLSRPHSVPGTLTWPHKCSCESNDHHTRSNFVVGLSMFYFLYSLSFVCLRLILPHYCL